MTLKLCSIAAALALVFGTTAAQAQITKDPGTKAERPTTERKADATPRKARDAEEEKIEAEAKADKAKCDALKANAKDVCMAEAKAKEKIAKAELDAKKDPSPRNQRKAAEMKAEGEYEVAKEKCDDMKGDEKNACQKQAKAKQDQAKADIKKQYAARKEGERPAAAGGTTAGTKK
jgi:hypothetical protein